MSPQDPNKEKRSGFEGEAVIIHGRLDDVQREQAEAKQRDEDYKKRNIEVQERMSNLQFAMVVLTSVLAVCGIIAGFIALWQTGAAERSAKSAERSAKLAEDALDASGDSFDKTWIEMKSQSRAMQSSADAARDAIQQNVASFRTDERAWIEIDSIKPFAGPVIPNFPPSFQYNVFLKNVGKTIAKDAVLRRVSSRGGYPNRMLVTMTLERLLKPPANDTTAVPPYPIPRAFAPNTVLPIPLVIGGAVPQSNYTVYDSMLGRVDYRDTFGIEHWMTFCFVVRDLAGDLQYCDYGNDEDRNPETPASGR